MQPQPRICCALRRASSGSLATPNVHLQYHVRIRVQRHTTLHSIFSHDAGRAYVSRIPSMEGSPNTRHIAACTDQSGGVRVPVNIGGFGYDVDSLSATTWTSAMSIIDSRGDPLWDGEHGHARQQTQVQDLATNNVTSEERAYDGVPAGAHSPDFVKKSTGGLIAQPATTARKRKARSRGRKMTMKR
ncbi:hypothetical protein EW146_g7677 [Bondarzewia mesenterica]|uniref:Uncharacterized protein n=1 Tax=Bondarzewia mesenterica TaxID=1095465 RepID=A0A4S4LLY9_9AGAM|nr:hypothetical protein EW146_g7677 [Bondarzewia mesenterica]